MSNIYILTSKYAIYKNFELRGDGTTKKKQISKEQIYKFFEIGASNSQIGRALNLTEATIRKYRREYENDREDNRKLSGEEIRKSKEIRNTPPGKFRKTEPEPNNESETQDPVTEEKTINFIGGKKNMNKNKTEDQDEGSECSNCGTDLNGQPKYCPGCGMELEWGE